ncbi:MAG: GNAT family N-acetyltransferase [Rhizobiaceae bacterium]|nr:GNAT family N-acetyltransferase [Rhizobiaceae bacterium]
MTHFPLPQEVMLRTALRNGREVAIRQVRPEDKQLFIDGHAELSPEDRYLRFFQHMPSLDDKLLKQLTELDHVEREAVGALDISKSNPKPIGVARYVAKQSNSDTAEFALTVASDYQGEGLGKLLLKVLADRAVANGFKYLSGLVLPQNTKMSKMLSKYEGVTKELIDKNLEFTIPLPLTGRVRGFSQRTGTVGTAA